MLAYSSISETALRYISTRPMLGVCLKFLFKLKVDIRMGMINSLASLASTN